MTRITTRSTKATREQASPRTPPTWDAVNQSYYLAPPDRQRAARNAAMDALAGTAQAAADKGPGRLLSKREVSEYFQRTQRWVDKQIARGHLARLRSPGASKGARFRRSDVEKLEELMSGVAS
jgi:hypothetical protein